MKWSSSAIGVLCCVLLGAPGTRALSAAAASVAPAAAPAAKGVAQGVPAKTQAGDASRAQNGPHVRNGAVQAGSGARGAANGGRRGKAGVHARDWAFSAGASSRDAWQQGVPCDSLQKKAVGEKSGNQSVNTAAGINHALETAGKEHKPRSGVGLSMKSESSSWREQSPPGLTQPDESLPLESRHVLRAYAGVEASEDLDIRLGPELILKNEQHERINNSKQPDSILGLGMQFKLDF